MKQDLTTQDKNRKAKGDRSLPIRQNDGKKREVSGFDGGKKVKGRKRQILVDSLGLVLKVIVAQRRIREPHVANTGERVLAAYAQGGISRKTILCLREGQIVLGVWLMTQARVEVIKRQSKKFGRCWIEV